MAEKYVTGPINKRITELLADISDINIDTVPEKIHNLISNSSPNDKKIIINHVNIYNRQHNENPIILSPSEEYDELSYNKVPHYNFNLNKDSQTFFDDNPTNRFIDKNLVDINKDPLTDIRLLLFDYKENLISSKYLSSDEYIYTDNNVDINIPLHIARLNSIEEGNYRLSLIFEKNVIDDIFIKEISTDKTELRIGINNYNDTWYTWTQEPSIIYSDYTTCVNVNGITRKIVNTEVDYEFVIPKITNLEKEEQELTNQLNEINADDRNKKGEEKEKQNRKIEKLQSQLDQISAKRKKLFSYATIILKLESSIKKQLSVPFDDIYLYTETYIQKNYPDVYIYSSPDDNFNIINLNSDVNNLYDDVNQGGRTIGWKTYEDLVQTLSGSFQSNLSSSFLNAVNNLSIDFSEWTNHTFFGSAYGKFINVFNKIKDIEIFRGIINSLPTSSDGVITSQSYSNKINDIETNMFQYENYVYIKSASYAWPKDTNNNLYSYSSSITQDWFILQQNSSINFDKNNKFALLKNIPETVQLEDNSEYLIRLVNAWGDFFDFIKGYIDQSSYLLTFDYDFINSVPKELLYTYAGMFGWKLYEGYDLDAAEAYIWGYNQTSGSMALKEITQEKWTRLLSNIPYLNKIRGTRRSIDAILNIYGIPNSILTIQEYGGSKTSGSMYVDNETNVHALNFYGGEYLYTSASYKSLSGSDFTIEMRVATTASNDMYLFGNQGFHVKLINNGTQNDYGTIILNISGSDLLFNASGSNNIDYYSGDYFNIVLQRTGSLVYLKTKRFKDEQIFNNLADSESFSATTQSWIDSGSNTDERIYFGSKDTNGSFTGSMQEIRLWNKYLTDTELDYHTFDFRSIATNNLYDTKNYLQAHYKLNDNHNFDTYSYVNDYSRNNKDDAVATNFSGNQFGNITKSTRTKFNNFTLNRYSSDKISIDKESGSQVPNSEIVNILFSPTNAINNDITHDFAMYDFNNAIGTPSDLYNSSYSNLNQLKSYYFNKLPGNWNLFSYLKFINNFDQSLIKMVKTMLPERTKTRIGVLIEPTILERNKYDWKQLQIQDLSYTGSIDDITQNTFNFSANLINVLTQSLYATSSIELTAITPIPLLANFYISATGSNGLIIDSVNALSGSAPGYYPVYEQLRFVTYVGTQNTPDTDYNGTPWIVSQSAGTILRVK